jgi:hypothetical protein
MASTVAARNVHFRIAALHHHRIAEILVSVFRSLLAPITINLAYRNSKREAPILFTAPFRDDDDTS